MTQLRDNPISLAEAVEYDGLSSHWRFLCLIPVIGQSIANWMVRRTARRYSRYLRNRCHDRS